MRLLYFGAFLVIGISGAAARARQRGWVYLSCISLAAIFGLGRMTLSGTAASIDSLLLEGLAAFVIGALVGGLEHRSVHSAAVNDAKPETEQQLRRLKKKRAARRNRALFKGLALIAVCSAVLSFAFAPVSDSGSASADSDERHSSAAQVKSVNILICGVDNDSNDEYHQQRMSDVIGVVSLDIQNKSAAMLQIPRDTYVGDKTSTGKINALYNNGRTEQDGISALMSEISTDLVLPIEHYVTVNMQGFRAAVDALGGVTVELDEDMTFNYYDEDENITGTVTLHKGANLLDGSLADLFVRYRQYANADLGRISVQRYFFAALARRVSEASVIELASTVKAVYPYINTDYSLSDLITLALEYRGVSLENITMLTVPGEALMRDGQSVYSAHKEALAQMLNEYMRPYGDPVSADELKIIELADTDTSYDNNNQSLSGYTEGSGG